MVELLHKDITSEIIAASFEVSNHLGVGFLEKVYENSLKVELGMRGLDVESQKQVFVYYKESLVGKYQMDLMVDGKVVVEVKTAENIIPEHKAQLINYLKITGLRVGLIINFYKTRVEYVRLVLEQQHR